MPRKTLKTLIGDYPHTAPIKTGAVTSERIDFAFTEIVPVWDGFKGMIREDRYDVSEMAVVTYLIAKARQTAGAAAGGDDRPLPASLRHL